MSRLAIVIFGMCLVAGLAAQQVLVHPYLQNASPTDIFVMWETDSNAESTVHWGATPALGNTASGSAVSGSSSQIHTVKISGLTPGTIYYYKAQTGSWQSAIFNFKTPDAPSSESPTLLLAMSDMQKDGGNPFKFNEIITNGILPYVDSVYGSPLSATLDFVMIPGDLVVNGNNWSQWRADFFGQSYPLFTQVPLYPVPGNHENDAAQFFSYFNLPTNGTPGYIEHWWYKDYSNVRVIGMDSNGSYRIAAQLSWLQNVLNQSCADTTIDFVFVQLHHPHKSELWLPGELNYTGDIINQLESFTSGCGKPSIHFFGHTHGYSRGQSNDHRHLWVNVATAGGNIDYWGEYAQADYDEFIISQDEYGFVMVEVTAGDSAQFVMKRLSLGDEFVTKSNTLEDAIILRKNNLAPHTPVPLFPLQGDTVSASCVILKADDFVDGDDLEQGASQWQVSIDSTDFSSPVVDSWKQYQNWYNEINTQASDDLTDEMISGLTPGTTHWWRVRYRDKGLTWSDWTIPIRFYTASSAVSGNLLLNGDAESATTGWTLQTGALESLSALECNGINPFAGAHYFAVGALCDEFPFASAYQDVDVALFADSIDAGTATAEFGAHLSDWNGNDVPGIAAQFLNAGMAVLGSTDTTELSIPSWTAVHEEELIPIGTRWIRIIIMGTRNSGIDNDSYMDEIYCRVRTEDEACSMYSAPGLVNGRLYVDQDAPGTETGESWQKAFRRIESALVYADSAAIQQIWVAEGTYYPTPGLDRTMSFSITTPLELYGGFNGNEDDLVQRDPVSFPTIMSGDIGIPSDSSDNVYHVIEVTNVVGPIICDGFTISGGMATDAPLGYGAGIMVDAVSTGPVIVRQCTLSHNTALLGGALFNLGVTQVQDCSFEENVGTSGAHAIFNHMSGQLSLQNVTVSGPANNSMHAVLSSNGAVLQGAGQITILKDD